MAVGTDMGMVVGMDMGRRVDVDSKQQLLSTCDSILELREGLVFYKNKFFTFYDFF